MISECNSLHCFQTTIHIIKVKNHVDGGWYRQITSKEGMLNRSMDRWYDHWNEKFGDTHNSEIKHQRWTDSDERIRDKMAKSSNNKEVYPELIKIHHDSVWDFFKSINYNHKDKRVSNIDSLIHIEKK